MGRFVRQAVVTWPQFRTNIKNKTHIFEGKEYIGWDLPMNEQVRLFRIQEAQIIEVAKFANFTGPISLGPRPRSVESRPDPSAPAPLRGSGVHSQVVAHPVIGCADGSCRLHSRSRLTNPSSRNRNATSNSALLGGDPAGALQVGVRAFRGPFAAISTPQFTRIF